MTDPSADGFPYPDYPTGWFQVAWSGELAPGAVQPLHYFGCDLVMFRGAGGRVGVLDAFCGHMGAHLGQGGCVQGEAVACPFHGWQWDADGRNVDIPYSARRTQAKRMRSWPVIERNGMIYIWNADDGADPSWEPPEIPEASSPDYHRAWPICSRLYPNVRIRPQFAVENLPDCAHFVFVHRHSDITELLELEDLGTSMRAVHRVPLRVDRSVPGLGAGPGLYEGTLVAQVWGLGLEAAWFDFDRSVHIQNETPVDPEHCDMRTTILLPKTGDSGFDDELRGRVEILFRQVERDINIWQHMRYQPRAAFTPEEARPFRQVRTWARRFYPSQLPGGGGGPGAAAGAQAAVDDDGRAVHEAGFGRAEEADDGGDLFGLRHAAGRGGVD